MQMVKHKKLNRDTALRSQPTELLPAQLSTQNTALADQREVAVVKGKVCPASSSRRHLLPAVPRGPDTPSLCKEKQGKMLDGLEA